jgi:hypothetical protein
MYYSTCCWRVSGVFFILLSFRSIQMIELTCRRKTRFGIGLYNNHLIETVQIPNMKQHSISLKENDEP